MGIRPFYPPRISIRKDDMNSAAQSILNNIEPEKVEELFDILAAHHIKPHIPKLLEESIVSPKQIYELWGIEWDSD
ncbi:MAG: hypothetical protein ACWGQW_26290 [bacterium]